MVWSRLSWGVSLRQFCGLIWLILGAALSPVSVALSVLSQDSGHELGSPEGTSAGGGAAAASGNLICIPLLPRRPHPGGDNVWSDQWGGGPPSVCLECSQPVTAFVTRCCLFCLEVPGQDQPAKWTFYLPRSLAGIPWVDNGY